MIDRDLLKAVTNGDGLLNVLATPELTGGLGWPVDPDAPFADEPEIAEGVKGGRVTVQRLVPAEAKPRYLVLLAEFAEPYVRRDLRELLRSLRKHSRDSARFRDFTGYEDTIFIVAAPNYEDVRFVLFEEQDRRVPRIRSFGWRHEFIGRTVLTHNLERLKWVDRSRWENAWDVEALTEQFYKDYERVFASTLAQVEGAENEKQTHAWTQLLFNRLLFIAFIQRMGWLQVPGGSKDGFLFDLYEAPRGAFNTFLGVLRAAFEELDTEETYQFKNKHEAVLGKIPYLNGGLFDKGDALNLPLVTVRDEAFAAVLGEPEGLFAKYNFTVTESTPLDQEVAVDPEMLGKIFERLIIAEERHKTGTYYTPRPIVEFMVNEALKGYLVDRGLPPEKAAMLVDEDRVEPPPHRLPDVRDAFKSRPVGKAGAGGGVPAIAFLPSEMQDTLEWLFEIRAVDPACGSGAYLLMLLQRLFELVDRLEVNRDKRRNENQKHLYETKLRLLQRCVYGVDLNETAIRIARLRLWLSLVVENRGERPDPLPNFDFLIMQGDSLASPIKPVQGVLGFPHALVAEYSVLKRRYFHPKLGEPRPLKMTMAAKRAEIAEWFRDELASSKLRSLSVKPFDWEVDFAEVFDPQESEETIGGRLNLGFEAGRKGQAELAARATRAPGFDIVVANPPYVNSGELLGSVGAPYKQALVAAYPNTGSGTADLLIFFFDRAMQLLRSGGTFAFITSNKWLKAGYGKKLRAYLAKDGAVSDLIDFHDGDVFQGTICYPLITIAAKRQNAKTSIYTSLPKPERDDPNPDLSELRIRFGNALPNDALGKSGEWRLETGDGIDRMAQMRSRGVPLGEYIGGRIYHGIQTSLNDVRVGPDGRQYGKGEPAPKGSQKEGVFIIDSRRREEILRADPGSTRLIRRLIMGRDIRRWLPADVERWLVVTKVGVDIAAYPGVRSHLAKFKEKATARREKGNHYWELRRCAYYDEFEQPKLVYQEIADRPRVALLPEGWYINNKAYMIPGRNLFLMGVMNSAAAESWLRNAGTAMVGGAVNMHTEMVERLPIPRASATDRSKIEELVEQILHLKSADPGAEVTELESEVDKRVEFLYFHADEAQTYDDWVAKRAAESGTIAEEIRALIAGGESTKLEFKETLEAGGTNPQHKAAVFHSSLKTICAFLNSGGGTLLIGVHDSGRIVGVEPDFRAFAGDMLPDELNVKGRDLFRQKLGNALRDRFIPHPIGLVEVDFAELGSTPVARIDVTPTKGQRVLLDGKLYVRDLAATHELDVTTLDYAQNRGTGEL